MFYKKLLLLAATACMSAHLACADQPAAAPVENYDSGKTKLIAIMADDQTGVGAFNKAHAVPAQTKNIAQDLNIDEIAQTFGCKTVMGSTFLTETLKNPLNITHNQAIITDRQTAIKLLTDPEINQAVGELLEQAKAHEQDVMKLLSEFFMGKTCPELKQLELIKKQNPARYPFENFVTTNPTGKAIATGANLIAAPFADWSAYLFAQVTYILSKRNHNFDFTTLAGRMAYAGAMNGYTYKEAGMYAAYLTLVGGMATYGLYKDYSMASEKRSKMHALNQLIAIAEKLESICAQNGLKSQFKINNITDTNGMQLIEKLKHSRYKHKKTLFFMTPLVHTFLYKLYDQEKHLAELFACIAELDAYHAIATKMVEAQNTRNQFCFVSFAQDVKPFIKTDGFWNVLVNNAVPNNLSEHKHIMLTGPNAGGKTTTIRALLQNIVLGQSFGIAAAQSFEFTPFDVIHSYLNVSDDLINGLSLFASEVKRAQEIVQQMKALEPGQKFFFALDELFTGTRWQDGQECAYSFIQKIGESANALFIYATHFDKLKELGKKSALYANYKVDAPTKDSKGKLVYPFTLSKGANETYVALDMAKEAQLFA